jgi:enterochelin esterase-like enzyme
MNAGLKMDQVNEMSFQAFAARIRAGGDDPAAQMLADSYLAAHAGRLPVIEHNTAHFLYRAPAEAPIGVGGDWNGFNGRRSMMEPLGGGLLHYQYDFAPDARINYQFFSYGADGAKPQSHADPFNLRIGDSGMGAPNELVMPGYRRPSTTQGQTGIPTGTLHPGNIRSKALREVRPYTVYLPAGYTPERGPYPSVYFHDGHEYLTLARASITLDNLIAAGAIPPLVAIFVPPVHRQREYNAQKAFARFFCDELVPAMQSAYALADDPARRATIGPSAGGLISLYLGSQRPDLFGLIGGQSSAIGTWDRNRLFDARRVYARVPRLPVRLHLVVGRYEICFGTDRQGRCRDLLTPNREFRAVLDEAGYPFQYAEWSQSHTWGLWRDSLPDALTYFYGHNELHTVVG